MKVLKKTMGDFLIVPENRFQIVIAERNFDGTENALRAVRPALPEDWGVLIGEIAHNLRAALDNLVYAAARKNRAPANVTDTQFPVFLHKFNLEVIRKGQRRVIRGFEGRRDAKRPENGRDMIRRLSDRHQCIIERLQPYKYKGGGRNNLFYLLSQLNNADKHRLIQVASAHTNPTLSNFTFVGTQRQHLTFQEIRAAIKLRRGGVFLEDGAKVGTIDARVVDLEPDLQITPFAGEPAFYQGCPALRGYPVNRTLDRIGKRVSEVVWRDFAPDFAPFPVDWLED